MASSGTDSCARAPLKLASHPVISMEEQTSFSHGAMVWNLDSANSNSKARVACNEILTAQTAARARGKYQLGLSLA